MASVYVTRAPERSFSVTIWSPLAELLQALILASGVLAASVGSFGQETGIGGVMGECAMKSWLVLTGHSNAVQGACINGEGPVARAMLSADSGVLWWLIPHGDSAPSLELNPAQLAFSISSSVVVPSARPEWPSRSCTREQCPASAATWIGRRPSTSRFASAHPCGEPRSRAASFSRPTSAQTCRSVVWLGSLELNSQAPESARRIAMSSMPASAAIANGDRPSDSRTLTLAPRSISLRTQASWPSPAAQCSGVPEPLSTSRLAPWSWRIEITCG
mmetsp:Transcript_15450/g.36725  ORF Transcript_15450/g.36725 Transcript_15450/m.36725 type:complete len:275 (-) Transcript_15450:107-931(-)